MKCENCHNNEATFFYQETVNGKTRALHLCAECAAKLQNGGEPLLHFPFHSLQSDLLDNLFGFTEAPVDKESKTACPDCGAVWADLLKTGKAVCPRCYQTFGEALQPTLRSLHGNVTHTGRAPADRRALRERKDRLATLRSQLAEAISTENFEDAARIRDEIRALEKEEA